MKNKLTLFAAGLILAAALFAACNMNGTGSTTREPVYTQDVMRTQDIMNTADAMRTQDAVNTDVTGTQDVMPTANGSGEPFNSGEPLSTANGALNGNETGFGGMIEGFSEGVVVDPSDVPDITDALSALFPEHTVQSMTQELYMGMQAYRVTLQGDGELARLVYVLGDGTVLIPGDSD